MDMRVPTLKNKDSARFRPSEIQSEFGDWPYLAPPQGVNRQTPPPEHLTSSEQPETNYTISNHAII